MVDIALFPIPGCVTFPGTAFPLHVFEPRYRTMIKHCIEHDLLLGVCHTQKIVSPAKTEQVLEEALHSNQATYKPFEVFSAGRCELLKTLEDGRLYLNVHLEQRYRLLREKQTLPFSIYECEAYPDNAVSDTELAAASLLQQKILKRLQVITNASADAQAVLTEEQWLTKEPVAFSYEIFGLLQFDAELRQQVLEMPSAQQRLEYLLALLNHQQ